MSTVVLFQRWQYSTLCLEETKCDESQLRIVIEHVFWTLVIMLPNSAHADGDDGEEVAETSDDKHNIRDFSADNGNIIYTCDNLILLGAIIPSAECRAEC